MYVYIYKMKEGRYITHRSSSCTRRCSAASGIALPPLEQTKNYELLLLLRSSYSRSLSFRAPARALGFIGALQRRGYYLPVISRLLISASRAYLTLFFTLNALFFSREKSVRRRMRRISADWPHEEVIGKTDGILFFFVGLEKVKVE